jgi:hypothetical protein
MPELDLQSLYRHLKHRKIDPCLCMALVVDEKLLVGEIHYGRNLVREIKKFTNGSHTLQQVSMAVCKDMQNMLHEISEQGFSSRDNSVHPLSVFMQKRNRTQRYILFNHTYIDIT